MVILIYLLFAITITIANDSHLHCKFNALNLSNSLAKFAQPAILDIC